MPRFLTSLALAAVMLSGCAQLPAEQDLMQLPRVSFGDPVPQNTPYILYFPAGKPIPTEILFDGSLLQTEAKQTLKVTLSKDIYSYKQWASFDGKHWQDARKLMQIKLDVKIPGYTHPQPGFIHLSVDELHPS
ncbi:MAG: hypothetical protein HY080_15045 [Gammaproteobacteria bacterium]|nr:hypothetical protein [Gammaproteobacteria bacterium]